MRAFVRKSILAEWAGAEYHDAQAIRCPIALADDSPLAQHPRTPTGNLCQPHYIP